MSDQKYKIMIVDDEKKNLKIMEDLLEDDYQIYLAGSGKECLDNYDEFQPDITLLDIMMPEMDGYEVCEEIVNNKNKGDAQIIFVSAKDTLEDRMKGYEYGATDYFAKPFDHDELLVKIKNVLSYKEQIKEVKDNAQNASQVAFKAMASASELGQVLRFMQTSSTIKSIKDLAKSFLETTANFSLDCTVQIRGVDERVTYNGQGPASPLEETILLRAKDKGRIYDSKERSIFNYELVSLFVKNMPIDDEVRYGEIKDIGCYLLDSLEARIINLNTELEVIKQRSYLISIIEFVSSTFEDINENMATLRTQGATIVEDMMEQMDDLLPKLGLEEGQENSLMTITEGGVEKTTALFNQEIKVDSKFMDLIGRLRQICDEENIDGNKIKDVFKEIL